MPENSTLHCTTSQDMPAILQYTPEDNTVEHRSQTGQIEQQYLPIPSSANNDECVSSVGLKLYSQMDVSHNLQATHDSTSISGTNLVNKGSSSDILPRNEAQSLLTHSFVPLGDTVLNRNNHSDFRQEQDVELYSMNEELPLLSAEQLREIPDYDIQDTLDEIDLRVVSEKTGSLDMFIKNFDWDQFGGIPWDEKGFPYG